ncbi:hypothetical protein L7F22_003445 [Adiantum nelumboides]|nr:hypothetical protein [Adiantum nelumboides]
MATRTSEFELFVMRFDGSNFAWWSSHMLDALTCLGQALPLHGKDVRPESMSDTQHRSSIATNCNSAHQRQSAPQHSTNSSAATQLQEQCSLNRTRFTCFQTRNLQIKTCLSLQIVALDVFADSPCDRSRYLRRVYVRVAISLLIVFTLMALWSQGKEMALVGGIGTLRSCPVGWKRKRQSERGRARAVLMEVAVVSEHPPSVTWQVAVGTIAGITPFVVAVVEFSKRIVAQRKCSICGGSGLIKRDEYYFRCYSCGGFLPWQSWKRFFSGK